MRPSSTLVALYILFSTSLPAMALDLEDDDFVEPASWTEIKEEKKGATCMDMCLAEGEALFDCEFYCIQTVKVGPLAPRVSCSRR